MNNPTRTVNDLVADLIRVHGLSAVLVAAEATCRTEAQFHHAMTPFQTFSPNTSARWERAADAIGDALCDVDLPEED